MSFNWQQAIGLEETHLVTIEQSAKNSYQIHRDVIGDLNNLLEAACNDQVPISIISSFRSFSRQLSIWNSKWQGHRPVLSRHGRPLNVQYLSDIEKYKAISLWSAMPGLSRHHWGTDIDIFSEKAIQDGHEVKLIPEEFSDGGVCEQLNHWLENNLRKFGFFRPYATYQNGVSEEPWHISHCLTSENVLNVFPYSECLDYIAQSDIKARTFIVDKFEHYREQYFLNICR